MKKIFTVVILFIVIFDFVSCKKSPTEPEVNTNPPAEDVWSSFSYPAFSYTDRDANGSGAYFETYVGDPDTLMKSLALQDCRVLYHDPGEAPKIKQISLVVDTLNGVAYTNGIAVSSEMTLFSSNYLSSIMSNRSKSAVISEIEGVLAHEETHIWQKNADYGSTDGWSVIEGEADAVRYLTGHDNIKRRSQGGKWTDGYTTTGFFIVWLQQNKDKDFLYKLNQYVGTHYEFNWDVACQHILNEAVVDLWNEYQAAIN
ncbi:MAG: basic secretory protein-like protein [Ignavibacteriaceae bacterium]|nr:basic secretory protein-like protein [Ignavibacteriaceae bacterium]